MIFASLMHWHCKGGKRTHLSESLLFQGVYVQASISTLPLHLLVKVFEYGFHPPELGTVCNVPLWSYVDYEDDDFFITHGDSRKIVEAISRGVRDNRG